VRFQGYVPNASGNVEATCYDNGQRMAGACNFGLANRFDAIDGYVCYSSICGS